MHVMHHIKKLVFFTVLLKLMKNEIYYFKKIKSFRHTYLINKAFTKRAVILVKPAVQEAKGTVLEVSCTGQEANCTVFKTNLIVHKANSTIHKVNCTL